MPRQTLPGWFFPLLTGIAFGAIGFGLALVAIGVWAGVIGQVAGLLVLVEVQRLRRQSDTQPIHG
jgi:hypothetical protein